MVIKEGLEEEWNRFINQSKGGGIWAGGIIDVVKKCGEAFSKKKSFEEIKNLILVEDLTFICLEYIKVAIKRFFLEGENFIRWWEEKSKKYKESEK